MEKTHKKLISVLLIILTLCSPSIVLASQRYYPGDEWPAEKNQVGAVDIYSEKEMDAAMYPISFAIAAVTSVTGAGMIAQKPATAMFQKIFVDMSKRYANKYGYIAAAAGTAAGTNSTALLWMNWPPSRYIFDNAEVKSFNVLGGAAANTLYGTLNGIANLIFFLTKAMVLIANNIIFMAFDTEWVQATADWISETTQLVAGEFVGNWQTKFPTLIFTLFLAILAGGIALYIYKGDLVKAGKVFMGAVLSIAALYFYLQNCTFLITSTANLTDALAGGAMEVTGVILPESDSALAGLTPLEKGLAQATNAAWTAIVACPWSWGQFGTADVSKLKLTASSSGQKSEWEILKDAVPDKQTSPPSGIGVRLSQGDLDAKKTKLYIDTLYLGSDDEIRAKLLQSISADQVGFAVWKDRVDHGNHAVTVAACQPSLSAVFRHIGVAVATVIPAISYLVFVLFLALPIIGAQLGIMIILIFLPLALLLGVAGEKGQYYLKKCSEFLLTLFSIKMIYGLYMGAVLFFGTLISSALLF